VLVLCAAMVAIAVVRPPWNITAAFALATLALAWPRK
jgi:hypothetical protein